MEGGWGEGGGGGEGERRPRQGVLGLILDVFLEHSVIVT